MTTYVARPTVYNGVQMRSRLEAEYAASLDGLAKWEYEPCCFANATGQYLPDFRVEWSSDTFEYVEVKPFPESGSTILVDAAKRMEIILSSEPDARLCVVTPDVTIPFGHDRFASGFRLFFSARSWWCSSAHRSATKVCDGRWPRS